MKGIPSKSLHIMFKTSFTINHLLIGEKVCINWEMPLLVEKVFKGQMFENMQQLFYIDRAGFVRKIQGLFKDHSRTFFIFQGLNFSQFCTMHFFQPEAAK